MEDVLKQKIINVARKELLTPKFAVTEQYLEVMELECVDGIPVVARFDPKFEEGFFAVYFSIKDEDFYISVTVKNTGSPEVGWVWIENGHRVYFAINSDCMSYSQLSKLLPLSPLRGFSKGELRKNLRSHHKVTQVCYEPNNNLAYSLEGKLDDLLTDLEKYKKTIADLACKEEARIQVVRYQYVSANAGINFSSDVISRLSKMNLEVDIDMYCVGEEIK